MKTTFAAALQLCGLSQSEAAEFFDVRLDTVKSWSAGRNGVPDGVWQMLADLWRRIEDAADGASANPAIADTRATLHLESDDEEGLPGGAAASAGAMALLLAIADGGQEHEAGHCQITP